jgi:hypothetical protein
VEAGALRVVVQSLQAAAKRIGLKGRPLRKLVGEVEKRLLTALRESE